MNPADPQLARIARLERTTRRQSILIAGLLAAAVGVVLGGAGLGGQPETMSIASGTYMGIAVDDDVIYRITAAGDVEQIAIGERRTALVELQIAEPRRAVPGIRWEPILQQRP